MTDNWQRGDTAAFEALFREYEKPVFRTAYLITGSREQAEDVLQAVFLSVWKSRATYNPAKSKLATWLHRITVNECARKPADRAMQYASLEDCEPIESQEAQPEEELLGLEERQRVAEALSGMDQKYRSVLVLHYFNDMPFSDIASILNIPLGTVKSRLNWGLKTVREKLVLEEHTGKEGQYEV